MANYILATAILTALSMIVSANSLAIDVQPRFVRSNDEDVTFTCSGGNATDNTLEKMLRMRLMKLDDDDQWSKVAVLRFDGSIDVTAINATAVGRLGNALASNLVVTWPVAPHNINGRYKCDAIALTNTADIVTEESKDVEVKSLMSNDMSLLLERLMKSEKRLVGKVNETMYRAMKSSTINLFSALDSKFGDIKEYLNNKTAVTASIRKPEERTETMQWPEGRFTLLMPDTGCPLYPPAWSKGFKKMKIKPGDKYYPIDVPLHLANPHKKDGFIYRQFCSLPASEERTKPWPEGSYCLFSVAKNSCPTGFQYVFNEVELPFGNDDNFYLYYQLKGRSRIGPFGISVSWFCCRHDGNASSPIDLPVSHPFYLHRHRGRCQEVNGMDVVQDVFMMETHKNDNYDKWSDNNSDFHPDVTFNPYKEDLCYYSRSRI